MEVLTDYRLPGLVHDLFVVDATGGFQAAHRVDPPERRIGGSSGVSEEILLMPGRRAT